MAVCWMACGLESWESQNKSLGNIVQIPKVSAGKFFTLGVCILLRVFDQVQGFPSNATLFQYLFTILFKLSAICFGCTTIFMRKYIHRKLA
jgi:hypothetical protein